MRRGVYLIGFCAWIFVATPPPVRADDPTLQTQYLTVYLKINDAEHLEKQGDFRGALEDFKDCFARLQRIHEEDPDWERALVSHRMDDCRAKIKDLTDKAAAQMDTSPATPPAPTAVTPPPILPAPGLPSPSPTENSGDSSAEVASLRQQLQDVKQKLQETQDKLTDSQAQVETYRSQLEAVNQQLAAVKSQQSVDQDMGNLLGKNKELTDKLAAAQKEIDDLKSNPKSKLAMAQVQLKNLQDQYAASQAANQALQQTTTNLQQQLNQAQNDLTSANQRLAAEGPGSADYDTLKHENEIMRDILTRELQEQAHRDMAKRLAQEEFDNLKLKSKVLQEQLDILGSPMTPPTNDQERALLASLKVPGPDLAQSPDSGSGNVLSAPAVGGPPMSDGATNMAAATAPTVAPAATNMASSAPPASGPAPDPASPPANPATTVAASPDSLTNSPDVTVVGAGPSMTTPPPASPATTATVPTPAPAATPVTTVASNPPATSPDPVPVTPVATPPATDPVSTPPTADGTTTKPTTTTLPPATTTYNDTTIHNGANAQQAPDPAEEYAKKARLPDDMRDTAQQAADLFKNQRYDDAAAKYQSILDKYPESLYAWSNLGVVRFQQGNLNEALKALQQAVKLSPTDAFSYSNLGIVYYQMGQYESAIEALNSAKALDPSDPKTHNYLGCACSQKGWQEVAEKEFRKAIELDPNFGDAHFNLALVYATSKPPSLELARREYNRALELGIAKDDRLEKLLVVTQQ